MNETGGTKQPAKAWTPTSSSPLATAAGAAWTLQEQSAPAALSAHTAWLKAAQNTQVCGQAHQPPKGATKVCPETLSTSTTANGFWTQNHQTKLQPMT